MDRKLLAHLQMVVREEAERLEFIKPSCASCLHYDGATCKEFDAVPPTDVLKIGCDSWLFDAITF